MISFAAANALALSLQDILAVAALVAAVVTAILTPVGLALHRMRKDLVAALEGLDVAADAYSQSTDVAALLLRSEIASRRAMASAMESSAGLHHRVLLGRTGEIDAEAAIIHLHKMRIGIDRAAAEAALLSSMAAVQVPALQQLVHRLGDAGTLELLNDAAAIGRIGSLETEDFLQAARQIAARLIQSE
ncbi:MAG TPA: hypothetical protein VN238_05575 [Solirubrobacteraceae bacterium]|nr:hypothetical protein [Solirubrobacteraceae bacterium]